VGGYDVSTVHTWVLWVMWYMGVSAYWFHLACSNVSADVWFAVCSVRRTRCGVLGVWF